MEEKRKLSHPEDEAPIGYHLEELRGRLIKIAISIFVGFFVCWPFKKQILLLLERPLPSTLKGKLVFLSPTEGFFTLLKICFFGGFILAFPFIVYQIWKFIEPGLYEHERKFVGPFILFSMLFFAIGALFAYFVIIPFALRFLLSFTGNLLVPQITIGNYVSFVIQLSSAFGIVFLLPVFVALLAKLGVVNYKMLERNRKYAIVIIFIVAAILTPPDVFSQVLMAVPLLLLYELSIWVARVFNKTEGVINQERTE